MHVNPYAAPLSSGAAFPAAIKPRPAVFQWPLVIAVIIWTAIAIKVANDDRSWGALGIAILYGPTVNAAVLLLAVVYGALRKFSSRRMSIGIPILVVLMTALASSVVIFGAIMSMDLHGC